MKKALYVPICTMAVVLAFSLWAGCFVENRTEKWSDSLWSVNRLAEQGHWTDAAERLDTVYQSWSDNKTFLHTIIKHDDLDRAESLFAGAYAACVQQDDPDFSIQLAQLVSQLELIAETQAVSIKNIL